MLTIVRTEFKNVGTLDYSYGYRYYDTENETIKDYNNNFTKDDMELDALSFMAKAINKDEELEIIIADMFDLESKPVMMLDDDVLKIVADDYGNLEFELED